MSDRILFARAGALGDFVLSLPALAACVATGRPVDVACPARYRPLVRLVCEPGRFWDIDASEALWLFGSAQDPVGYAEIVCFSQTMEPPILKVRRIAPRPPAGVPAAEHFAGDGDPDLRLSALPSREDRPIVICPGASGGAKVWRRWDEVAARLDRVMFVGGPLEPEMDHRPDLSGLIALAASAGAWLGADSGPSHLASMLDAPTAVVFTSTDPAVWAPRRAAVFDSDVEPEALADWVRDFATPSRAPGGVTG